MRNIAIRAFGRGIAQRVVENSELAGIVDTSDDWIFSHTGIRTRRISGGEDTSELCIRAALNALEAAGLEAHDIDIIIVATTTPDFALPSTACLVQAGIGAENAFAFDVSAACSGFIYALSLAEKYLRAGGAYRNALVIGADVLSKITDWGDRKTCILFGDGAGAAIVCAEGEGELKSFILAEELRANGKKGMALIGGAADIETPFYSIHRGQESSFIQMDGRAVFDFATRQIPQSITNVLERAGLNLESINSIIPHQANARIVEIIAKRLGCSIEKFAMNIENYGNTSAASIPMLMSEMCEDGSLLIGNAQKYVLTGFGAGLTWGSILIEI